MPAGEAKSEGAAATPKGEATGFESPVLGPKRDEGAAGNAKAGLNSLGVAVMGAGSEAGASAFLAVEAPAIGAKAEGTDSPKSGVLMGAGFPERGASNGEDVGGGLTGVVDGSPMGDFPWPAPKPAPKPANALVGADSSAAGLASGDDTLGALPNAEPVDPNAEVAVGLRAGADAVTAPLTGAVSSRDAGGCCPKPPNPLKAGAAVLASPPKMLVPPSLAAGLLAAEPKPPKPPWPPLAEKPAKTPPAGVAVGEIFGPEMLGLPKIEAAPKAEEAAGDPVSEATPPKVEVAA